MKHSDGEVLVRVEGLSKKFCRNLKRSLIYGGSDIMKGFLGIEKSSELRNEEFWAIDNVNFELRRGECLGLIGHNGAGKSTLLKMLNGLIRPDKGRIEMNGKVGALIELGAGFSPFLTGRENVYNNGAVLGFSKAEIDQKFDEIVEFAELKDFIDTPVQNYSSGMKVRLGFAVAAQMEPDILLVDEVLAVGDMGFVMKCFNRMDKLLQNTAMIFVSHAMPQVARMSTSLLMLEKGKQIIYSDNITDGLAEYYNRFNSEIGDYNGTGEADLLSVEVGTKGRIFQKNELIEIEYGADLTLDLQIDFKRRVENPDLYLVFYDKEQRGFAEIFKFRNSNTLSETFVMCSGSIKSLLFCWLFSESINSISF
jgi:lipopolysaccharide transport system ATP-binding protein